MPLTKAIDDYCACADRRRRSAKDLDDCFCNQDRELRPDAGRSARVHTYTDLLTREPGYYDAMLMDIQVPAMNGYDAAWAIRALENQELANIPILAMTANAFARTKRRCWTPA